MPSPARFKKTIWDYYKKNGRDFAWRRTRDPYKILVSEIMLQQTQAPRVVFKYEEFLTSFPTLEKLARAPLKKVLAAWQGLGYNRRGAALHQAAKEIISRFKGKFPRDTETLVSLPGIGPATAGDLLAFVWNKPVVVIETNIRSVFIHFFFQDRTDVHDREILPLIEKTLDQKNPREWYFALMDYGAMLKKTKPNPSRRSKHYTRQSPFKGSNRELRSKILKYLLNYKAQTPATIALALSIDPEASQHNLNAMHKEGLIAKKGNRFFIP